MLDQKVFLQGINYLKANYLNWSFDLNNDLMLQVWYKKFKNLEPTVYMGMVDKYTDINKYAPNSPADLMEVLKLEMEKKELDANQAWLYVNELRNNYAYFLDYDNKIYSDLADKPALLKTFKEFERDIFSSKRGDTYISDAFKKAYLSNLKERANEQVCALLGINVLFLE